MVQSCLEKNTCHSQSSYSRRAYCRVIDLVAAASSCVYCMYTGSSSAGELMCQDSFHSLTSFYSCNNLMVFKIIPVVLPAV